VKGLFPQCIYIISTSLLFFLRPRQILEKYIRIWEKQLGATNCVTARLLKDLQHIPLLSPGMDGPQQAHISLDAETQS